jgi:DNA-directed RNA polymerase subunit RPC12/RpoP
METVKMNIVSTKEIEIPKCPYCGGKPNVAVAIKQEDFKSDSIVHQEVTCPYCGMSAPIEVWEEFCAGIEFPVTNMH